jgi:hypothetical protein
LTITSADCYNYLNNNNALSSYGSTPMQLMKRKPAAGGPKIIVNTLEEPGCQLTRIKISGDIEVASRDGWLCFWTAGREVRVGPLTPDQAEKFAEDLGYEALD